MFTRQLDAPLEMYFRRCTAWCMQRQLHSQSRCCRCGVLQEFRELSRVMLSGRDNKLRVRSLAAFCESHGHDLLSLSLSFPLSLSLSPTLSRSFSNDACNEMSLVLHSAMHLKWAAFLKGCPVAIAVISRLTESGWGNEGSGGSKEAAVAMSRNVAAENLNYL